MKNLSPSIIRHSGLVSAKTREELNLAVIEVDMVMEDQMVSTAKIAETLKGVDFPEDKLQIIEYARKIMHRGTCWTLWKKTPCPEFNNMANFLHYVGKVL
jgi:hypothetical protein